MRVRNKRAGAINKRHSKKMADRESLLNQFCSLTGAPRNRGQFFLEASSWNLQAAMDSFYDNPEGEDVPTPQQASDWPSSSSKHFASMGEFQQKKRSQPEEGDSQNFFAGGSEHSGQLISGPPREKKGPKDMAQAVFDAAKQHGARSVEDEEEEERKARNSKFGGQGFKLGQTSGKTPAIGKKEEPAPESQNRVVIRFWSNGFSVDDGPLRDGSTPEDQEFLDAVSKGEIPSELRRSVKRGEVNVDIEDHRKEEYRVTPPKVKAFSGEGHKLGNVAPKIAQPSTAVSPAGNQAAPKQVDVPLDPTQPTTQIQIRLADGSRLVAKFNHTHTVGDVRRFIEQSRPSGPSNYKLMTTFPNKELTDNMATLAEAQLINAVIVQRAK